MSSSSSVSVSSSTPTTTDDYSDDQTTSSDSSGQSPNLTASAIIFVLVLAFLLFAFHLITKWLHTYIYGTRSRRRRTHSVTINLYDDDDDNGFTHAPRGGLDKAEISLLPSFIFNSGADPVECAVCLSDFQDNEQGRLLPACKHSFHVDCIDMWLFTHSTCPLCRAPVSMTDISTRTEGYNQSSSAAAGAGAATAEHTITIITDQPESSSATAADNLAKPPINPQRRSTRHISIQIPSRPDAADLILRSPSPGACLSLPHGRLSRRASPSPGAARASSPASARLALKRILSCGAQSSFSGSAVISRPSEL